MRNEDAEPSLPTPNTMTVAALDREVAPLAEASARVVGPQWPVRVSAVAHPPTAPAGGGVEERLESDRDNNENAVHRFASAPSRSPRTHPAHIRTLRSLPTVTAPIEYRHDRLVVPIDRALTWDSALALVTAVDARLEHYHYRRVEVVVSSPGGLVAALEYVVCAFARWRAGGVEVRTRVVATAASAAAVLVSLGDARSAAPGARLLYHLARVPDAGIITARASAELLGELSRTDARLVSRLVERALEARDCVPHRAEPCDREALEHLVAALAGAAPARGRRPRLKRLAARVGRALDAAVRTGDRDTVTRAYRALARVDRPISAELARTLRLIDRIDDASGVSDVPEPEPEPDPRGAGLTIPEWRSLYPPSGAVPRAALTRHTIGLGETGSGKTASVIVPVLSAMVRAEHLGGALVIDPKRELEPVLEREAPKRLVRLDTATVALDLMAGARAAVDADLAAGRWTSAAVRMLLRVASFLPASPLRTLGPHQVSNPNAEFFAQEGTALLRDVLGLVLMLCADGAPPPHEWVEPSDESALRWVHALGERARGGGGLRGPNALALCAFVLEGPLAAPVDNDDFAQAWRLADLARQALPVWGAAAASEGRDLLARIDTYWRAQARVTRQYTGVFTTARTACADLASPRLARTLYFGCEPGWRDAQHDAVDFARLVSPAADGRLLLHQPRRDGRDALLAMALKAAFFEAVLTEPARIRAEPGIPLVGYVADEFHRFVTSDAVHGEQSFLDTCRSHGAFCVLATQSTRSIAHALSLGGAGRETNEAALDILLANTATKLFFRSTDPDTAARVAALCPHRPGFAPATAVRPPATLAPGEAYASLPDGRFERRQLELSARAFTTTTETTPMKPPARPKSNPHRRRTAAPTQEHRR